MLAADPHQAAAWKALRADLAVATAQRRGELLSRQSDAARLRDIQMIGKAGLGHVGGDLSCSTS